MEHLETYVTDGEKAARAIELAHKARHARRMALEFVRRWAVEQTVENVGLVALNTGVIDLPCPGSGNPEIESSAAHDS